MVSPLSGCGPGSCKLVLGPYPVLGLAAARERAIVALGQVAGAAVTRLARSGSRESMVRRLLG